MIIKFILFITIAYSHVLGAENYAEMGLPVIEVYDSFTHQGANQNWWLTQAENGLIYNGTGTGLNEWDGEQWRLYHTPNKSRIRALSIWTDGKIYVGTINDLGYYHANESGELVYHSLLNDWPSEEKQFGEVWSVASNPQGVMFLTSQNLFFWDGQNIKKIDALVGSHRIFSVDDVFYFKPNTDPHIYIIDTRSGINVKKTGIVLAENVSLRQVFRNNNGRLTLVTAQSGLYEIINNQAIKQLDYNILPDQTNIFNAIQANDSFYYLTSLFHGLFIVDSDFKLAKHYRQEHGFGTDTLLSVIEDYQQNIWISGVPNIIKMIPPHRFSHYETEDQSNLSEGITLINDQVISFGESVYGLQNDATPSNPAAFKLLTNKKNNIWDVIEFRNHLVFTAADGVFALPIKNDVITASTITLVETHFAKNLAIDERSESLFVTADEGLFRVHFENNQWHSKKIPDIESGLHYLAIHDEIIWAGTATQQLFKIEHAQDDNQTTLVTEFNDQDGLGKNNVVPFVISWGVVFGTNDGLMDYQQDRKPELKFLDNLPAIFHSKNKDVYRLYEDSQKNLWYRISSHTGYLSQDDNQKWQINEQMFKYFPDSGYKDFIKSSDNILWFSLANGDIYRANTELIQNIPVQGKLNIRHINNIDTGHVIYGGLGPPYLPELAQENNSIRINFALADNSIANATEENQVTYRHRLIGSDQDGFSKWSIRNSKDFTMLRGGDYRFEVEARDAWGRINDASINFKIQYPWYLTTTAWVIYTMLGLLTVIIISWLTQKWRTKKLTIRNQELAEQVAKRTAEVQSQANELKQQQILKDRFFTNVSHEFRTPLTLTISPLEAFLNDHKDLDSSLLHPIKTALRNSKSMLSLVGQVLDINRLESGQFPVRVAKFDISDLINRIIIRFKPWAKKHQQELIAHQTQDPKLLYFDQDLIDKCISNLISNAIKYSGKSSRIEVTLICQDEYTGIKVKDNGVGINPEFEDKLFERFTQDQASEEVSEPGTGIGLALVKELIELHHGHIEWIKQSKAVHNHNDVKNGNIKYNGCTFILWLPNDKNVFDKSQLIEPLFTENEFDNNNDLLVPLNQKMNQNNEDITTLLLVDDNQELREFIASRLSTYYRIIEAINGKEGFSLAVSNLPDLIISDVMMPEMDGFEMVKELKQNKSTQNIPVILLTARSSKRDTVEGLQTGADDYLSKPFDTSELMARIAGIINIRKQIRAVIKAEMITNLSQLDHSEKFVDLLRSQVISQLSNPKLSVTSLSETLGMSRFTLNRKCKLELNKTAGQFITETRMQQALSLLKLNQHTVSEVAYGTGYDSLAYFSQTFKKHFGKSPSEAR